MTAGVDMNGLLALGIPPWETRERGPEYVRGRYSDEGPLCALLWADLRAAYRRNHIPHQHAAMFELSLAGVSDRGIANMFGLASHRSVQYRVERVRAALAADPALGIITVIREECGGWAAVAEYLFANREKKSC